jgi:hypothetical protein
MSRIKDIDHLHYDSGFESGVEHERQRIIENINERIEDLRTCSKIDNCHELAELIESYIPEWTEEDTMSHTPNHIDTGPTSAFYQGRDAGIKEERERIVKILQQAPHLMTSGLMQDIAEDFQPDESNYERGLSDSGDALDAVVTRLVNTLHDMEELGTTTEREQHLLHLLFERYTEKIWEARDNK